VRDRLKGAQNRIVKRLESFLSSLSDRFVVPDASVTIRDGRFVIPVRREGKGEVGGIVHDESQTGATLYMEPPVAIEATNQLRELEREEAREIRRILGELTERLAPRRHELKGAFDALADFDALHARARTAVLWKAAPPRVDMQAPGLLELRGARHPLLIEAGQGTVIPYDLTLDHAERCLVVSGPNTGGKSVFLKATGLIAVLTQSGIVPPVGPGTRLPVFNSFFADIGDEQSIARNLSTFSAHLENLKGLVMAADERSLVLVDEMGTGTDPAEGAALSRAVLEALVARGATTIVSSHLGELKQLDGDGSGIVNASMHFDSEKMAPTYRLTKGRPGRSYGLAIARRLGFPGDVLDRAESYRDSGAARMEDVLERLEEQEQQVERLLHELDLERRQTNRLRNDVESREQTLSEAERTAEGRARADARQLLMDARAEVESVIVELRSAAEEGRDLEEAARVARQRVERSAARQREGAKRGTSRRGDRGKKTNAGAAAESAETMAGAHVRIRSTGAKGRILEHRGNRVVVEVGALRFEVADDEVESVEAPAKPEVRERAGGWSGSPTEQTQLEVDLRGLRVDEMGLELQRALDQAVLDDLSQLRIIHGMGTGALRKRVAELLKLDRRVGEFRIGGRGEGGAGVTVATFGGRG
jgi:DNA mismatch repair protein MutS2